MDTNKEEVTISYSNYFQKKERWRPISQPIFVAWDCHEWVKFLLRKETI